MHAVCDRRQQCERGWKRGWWLIVATIGLMFVAGCAARSQSPPPLADASCTVANLDQLGTSAIPITVAGHDSMTGVAKALAAAAARTDPDAQPFAFKVRFDHPFTARGDDPADFVMTGLFERPCDASNYLALGWGYSRRDSERAYAAIVPLAPPQDCPARRTTVPSIEAIYSLPVPEPEADHPPVHGWQVDFPQLTAALRKNRASFANGVEAIEVTTARRLRLDDARPSGCVRTVYSRSGHRRLDALDGSRPVMELAEAGQPSRKASLAGYCTTGHYLILDAVTAEVLERGRYQRCEYFAAEQI